MTLERFTIRTLAVRSLTAACLTVACLTVACLTVACLTVAMSLFAASPAAATSADLLEQAIYAEETVGDLEAAVSLYEQIVADTDGRRPVVAQALYRLGLCRARAGESDAARAAFERLLDEYSDAAELVARARTQLAALESALDLAPVPWHDGEFLRYRMRLPTGRVIGTVDLHAVSTVVDGRDAWRLELRRFVTVHSDNYGVSRTWVDAATQRPIRSSIRHGLLGSADAVYGPDGVRITGGGTADDGEEGSEVVIDAQGALYDNDQSMHLIRLLPLVPGYEAMLRLLPIWTGEVLDIGLEVKKSATCRVPAGEYECLKVELGNGETHWYSTDPEQRPLKVSTAGVEIELVRAGTLDPSATVPFKVEGFEIAGSLPPGWLPYQITPSGRDGSALVRMLDPSAAAISGLEADRCPRRGCPPLDDMVERERKGAERRFDGYALRTESWQDRTIDGRRIVSFAADYLRNDQPWVQYRNYLVVDEVRLELIFRVPAERFDALRGELDAIVESLHGE
ncbi:MAG: tetratricopeptide repeat protein [Acidobacteriota bacterium]